LILEIGPQVEVMAIHQNQIVLCRQGNYLAGIFHSELTEDFRIHDYFIKMLKEVTLPSTHSTPTKGV
jgi:5'-phosphate synthase pdxT subunit